VNIGTPAQSVVVALDTGSSELWVDPDCANAGSAALTTYCLTTGSYNPSLSTTSSNLGATFDFGYGKGEASGTYYTDSVGAGTAIVTKQQFGVASASNDLRSGILGVGLNTGFGYNSFIESLQAQGKINSVAFGLDLGAQNDPTGKYRQTYYTTYLTFQAPLSLVVSTPKSTSATW
jgi:hypothetical protein